MRWLILILTLPLLAGCSAAHLDAASAVEPGAGASVATPARAALPDLGPAPEFTNSAWLNTDRPLRLADLRGQVVALDMWTFG